MSAPECDCEVVDDPYMVCPKHQEILRAYIKSLESQLASAQIACVNDHASVKRLTDWLNNPKRKPAIYAFTEGPERTMAYWFENYWREAKTEIESLKLALKVRVDEIEKENNELRDRVQKLQAVRVAAQDMRDDGSILSNELIDALVSSAQVEIAKFQIRESEMLTENDAMAFKINMDQTKIAKLEAVRVAAEKFDKEWWFQPGPDRGCCGLCEAGSLPDFFDKHQKNCSAQIVHEALVAAKVVS